MSLFDGLVIAAALAALVGTAAWFYAKGRRDENEMWRATHLHFRFVPYRGLVISEGSEKGCRLWYRQGDYPQAFDDEDFAL